MTLDAPRRSSDSDSGSLADPPPNSGAATSDAASPSSRAPRERAGEGPPAPDAASPGRAGPAASGLSARASRPSPALMVLGVATLALAVALAIGDHVEAALGAFGLGGLIVAARA